MDLMQQHGILPINRNSDDLNPPAGELRRNLWAFGKAVLVFGGGAALLVWLLLP